MDIFKEGVGYLWLGIRKDTFGRGRRGFPRGSVRTSSVRMCISLSLLSTIRACRCDGRDVLVGKVGGSHGTGPTDLGVDHGGGRSSTAVVGLNITVFG